MDKEQATNHILTRLRGGFGREEIVEEMSLILKAPAIVIRRFVDQVISNHPEDGTATTVYPDMPELMEPLPIRAEDPQAEPSPSFAETDLPPGLQDLLKKSSAALEAFPALPVEPVPVQHPLSSPDKSQPQQAALETPVEKSIDLKSQDEASKVDLEALNTFTFRQLKKRRRHNDIVEAVCHQTGWHWNQSQRFVARIQTKHHHELQSSKNRVIIVIGIGIILLGLILALNGANSISDYAKLAAHAKTNPEVLLNASAQGAVYALATIFTGMGMIIGGGFGIARALSNQ